MEIIFIVGILVGIIGILVGVGEFIIVSKLANAVRILGRISNTLERIEKQMEEPEIQVVNDKLVGARHTEESKRATMYVKIQTFRIAPTVTNRLFYSRQQIAL